MENEVKCECEKHWEINENSECVCTECEQEL